MGSWNFDCREDKLTWTDGLYDVFGVDKNNFLETHGSFINFVVQEDKEFVLKTSKHAQQTGQPFNIEYCITTPKGENRIIEEFGYSEKNVKDEIVRLFGTAQDITERKQLQHTLILSEIKYKTIFEDNPLPMVIWDFETLNIIDCNNEALLKYGYTKEEFLKLNIKDIRPSEDVSLINDATVNETIYGQVHKKVWRHLKKNGELILMEVNGHLMDYNGKRVSLVMLNDVTEKKKLEALLKKSNRLASVGSWEIDVINNTVYWSDITKEIREVEPDYVPDLKTAISYFKEGKSRDTITQKVKNCIEKGTPWDEELQFFTHKGNLKWVRTIGEPEIINGKCVKIYGSFQDITESIDAQEAIRDSEEKRRLIMNGALDAIICIDTNETITFWNPSAETIFGWKEKEVIGKQLSELIIPVEYRKYHVQGLKHYLKTGEGKALNVLLELSSTKRNGEEFPIELTVLPIKQGEEQFFCAFIRDISQRKESENSLKLLNETLKQNALQLSISNSELEQFAYVASHDLQEPLRMVTSFLTLLEKKYGELIDDKGKQYIYFATDGAKRMRQIILDLLEFSRVGRIENAEEAVNITDLVNDVIFLNKKIIEETHAKIEVEKLPIIKSYKSPLNQVFLNLIGNALKYRQINRLPIIKISCLERQEDWLFNVKDNGIGISTQYFEKIFIIFQRLHHKEEYSGSGIGLAIVKKIINNLNGKIWVESEEGNGSSFYFTLPKLPKVN